MDERIFGRLTPDSLTVLHAFKDPTTNNIVDSGAAGLVIIGGIVSVLLLTVFRLWTPLFRDWIFSVDHKRIGVMYIVLALIMLARGIAEGVVMRWNQSAALGGGPLDPDHVGQLFSTHGTIMIFFVAMPMIFGLMNFVVPLQIGARDMAFPVLNQISLGLTATGAALLMISLVVGEFTTGGWTAYPPYTGAVFSPGVGPDYWIWAIILSGVGSTLSGLNFAVTIYKERAPGMKLMRMPLFTWTALVTSILVVFALPPLTAAAALQGLDRYLDFHFFTNDLGGNMMVYANLFWMFGHPEVYILILPAYGVFSEISATYSAKRLYGYNTLVGATLAIAVVSFMVWVHHFFTMGQSATINAAFGIATLLISIPTGVKIYDWMATLYRGRIRMSVPIVYMTGFFFLFVIGGASGVVLANPTIDYQVHNSLFLVAHFHNVIIPGVLFGILAGLHYWFPKVFGFRLHEGLGKITAMLWIVGFSVTFFPLYGLGLMGMPRRSASFQDPSYEPLMQVAFYGSLIVLLAFAMVVVTLLVSISRRKELATPLGDPWDGRTLEWSCSAPPPPWNFAVPPTVNEVDAFAAAKERGDAYAPIDTYVPIKMPGKTPIGFIIFLATTLLGFAMTWWIWWLAGAALLLLVGSIIVRSYFPATEIIVPAEVVAREDRRWRQLAHDAPGITRDDENSARNLGRAAPDMVAAE
ncbi:MAG: cbb3-type cytochrome c oxidase subunit I [Rhodobacteraceae bacterium]|nr:cbb3-type cytochrome c oxidase subunit I [Paracoccaceae bacterium]